jgi:glutaredoxin-related protein
MNEELMDKIIEKCKNNPEFAEVFDYLMKGSQAAAHCGFTMEEVATICTVGFMIGCDPKLAEMVKNMAAISKMGLDIVDK